MAGWTDIDELDGVLAGVVDNARLTYGDDLIGVYLQGVQPDRVRGPAS